MTSDPDPDPDPDPDTLPMCAETRNSVDSNDSGKGKGKGNCNCDIVDNVPNGCCNTYLYRFDGEMDERFLNATPKVRASIIQMYYVIVDNAQLSTRHDNGRRAYDDMRAHYESIIHDLRVDLRWTREDANNRLLQERLSLHNKIADLLRVASSGN